MNSAIQTAAGYHSLGQGYFNLYYGQVGEDKITPAVSQVYGT